MRKTGTLSRRTLSRCKKRNEIKCVERKSRLIWNQMGLILRGLGLLFAGSINAFTTIVCGLLAVAMIVVVTVAVCKHVYAPTVLRLEVSKSCWGDV